MGLSSKKNKSRSDQKREDYEYFQLYDPEEWSDVEYSDDDLTSMVKNGYSSQSRSSNPGSDSFCPKLTMTRMVILGVTVALIIILLAVAMGLGFGLTESSSAAVTSWANGTSGPQTSTKPAPVYQLRSASEPSVLGNFSNFAVAIDGEPCAQIGVDVLQRNGTAVDAVVAALFCNGLVNSHSMGIGGGFLMTIYIKETGEFISLDARESAPGGASVDMYKDDEDGSQYGPRSAAVPGEIKGYWEAKKRFGNDQVTWASLVQPSIDMCRQGIPVTFSAASNMKKKEADLRRDPGMREIFINPLTNQTWEEGQVYKRENLAKTLERIASLGADEFYSGETAKNLIADMTKSGGIMTLDDLKSYKVLVTPAVQVKIQNHTLASVPPPGSGSILAYILNILQHFNLGPKDDVPLTYHRMAEAFKWAYAQRSKLGDPADEDIEDLVQELVKNMTSPEWGWSAFQKIDDLKTFNDIKFYGGEFYTLKDHGTAHAAVLAPNGDAVSVTSTINLHFGGKFMSPSTGIIMNDEMDDFSYPSVSVNYFGLPPSPNNFVKPGKRPLSSMSPAIVTDPEGRVQMVIGAAGGTKITTAVAFTIVHNIWLQKNIKASIDERRIHHQLAPMELEYEVGLDQEILHFLMSRGHKTKEAPEDDSIVCGISREEDGRIYANADFRKAGGVAGA